MVVEGKVKETRKQSKRYKLLKSIWHYFLLMISTIALVAILRVFLFASFKIPSPSMEPALVSGDYIIVNKLIPGSRIFTSLDFKEKVNTKRFPGYRDIERNDILVFNFPYIANWDKIKMDISAYYVKRCVAIPGDTFYINNGIYKVKNIPDTLGYYANQLELSNMDDKFFMEQEGIYNAFPFDTVNYNWTIKNFGPLYIPKIGTKISIDSINIKLYKNIIEYETEQLVSITDGIVYLDKKALNEYSFQMNYYFMAGDLVFDSKDSRYWGLLPEDHIIGKAAFIWKSKNIDTDSYQFDRFFKSVK